MPPRNQGTSRRLRMEIPDRGAVIVVGRTVEDCDRLITLLKPRVQAKGGTLSAFSQLHQLDDLAGKRVDLLVLHPSLGPTARDVVINVAERSNRDVKIYEFPR